MDLPVGSDARLLESLAGVQSQDACSHNDEHVGGYGGTRQRGMQPCEEQTRSFATEGGRYSSAMPLAFLFRPTNSRSLRACVQIA
jgi:hypothetical protein